MAKTNTPKTKKPATAVRRKPTQLDRIEETAGTFHHTVTTALRNFDKRITEQGKVLDSICGSLALDMGDRLLDKGIVKGNPVFGPAPAVVEPWISVEDRLPDLPIIATDGSRFSETVLVFRSKAPKHTCVGESQYGDYGSGDAGWLGESGQGVTHWMPLPSPPSPSTT